MTNGTYSGDTTITDTATVTITADSGYTLPDTVTVSGASQTWNKETGTLTLSNPTGAVAVSAVCEAVIEQKINITLNPAKCIACESSGTRDAKIKFGTAPTSDTDYSYYVTGQYNTAEPWTPSVTNPVSVQPKAFFWGYELVSIKVNGTYIYNETDTVYYDNPFEYTLKDGDVVDVTFRGYD